MNERTSTSVGHAGRRDDVAAGAVVLARAGGRHLALELSRRLRSLLPSRAKIRATMHTSQQSSLGYYAFIILAH